MTSSIEREFLLELRKFDPTATLVVRMPNRPFEGKDGNLVEEQRLIFELDTNIDLRDKHADIIRLGQEHGILAILLEGDKILLTNQSEVVHGTATEISKPDQLWLADRESPLAWIDVSPPDNRATRKDLCTRYDGRSVWNPHDPNLRRRIWTCTKRRPYLQRSINKFALRFYTTRSDPGHQNAWIEWVLKFLTDLTSATAPAPRAKVKIESETEPKSKTPGRPVADSLRSAPVRSAPVRYGISVPTAFYSLGYSSHKSRRSRTKPRRTKNKRKVKKSASKKKKAK